MKKNIVLAFLFFAIIDVNSQEWIEPEKSKFTPINDIRIGIGWKPFEAAVALENIRNWNYSDWDGVLIDFELKDYYKGARYTTNAIFAEYISQKDKTFGFGATIVYFSYFNKYFDQKTDLQIGNNIASHFSIFPTMRFSWLNNPKFSIYTAFGLGPRIVFQTDILRDIRYDTIRYNIAGQFTLLGLTFGEKIYCFTDLSTLGSQGFMTFGIGYRFINTHK